MQTPKVTIALADDHLLFLKSLLLMLNSFQHYEVIAEAANGHELQQKIEGLVEKPKIILLDVNMPRMGGEETAAWLTRNYPDIKLVALTMNDDDQTIIRMFRAGCCAYLLKETHPDEFEKALEEICEKGYYNADAAHVHFRRLLNRGFKTEPQLSEREKHFLQLACSELTYKQIANEMHVSERTVDGYRESIFEKFNVQSRVGMALEAIRKGWVRF